MDKALIEAVVMLGMLIVGFLVGYTINSQAKIDAAYNTCAVQCNELLQNISNGFMIDKLELINNVTTNYINQDTTTGP